MGAMNHNNHDQRAGLPQASSGPHSGYRRARGFLGSLEKILIALGAACILIFGAYITLGIIFRSFIGSQIYDEVVIVGELMVGALILPLAFIAADRGFIAVEVLTSHFGRKTQNWLNVLTALVGLAAVMPITYAGFLSFIHAWEEGNFFFGLLELPEWPGRFAFLVGYLFFLLRLIDLLIHDGLVAIGRLNDPDLLHDPDGSDDHDYAKEEAA